MHSALHCKEIFARLSEFLDGELPEDVCRQVREHVEGCAPCIEFLESLRRSVELTRQAEPGGIAPTLNEEQKQRLLEAYRSACGPQPERPM